VAADAAVGRCRIEEGRREDAAKTDDVDGRVGRRDAVSAADVLVDDCRKEGGDSFRSRAEDGFRSLLLRF